MLNVYIAKSIDYGSFEEGQTTENVERLVDLHKQGFPSRTPIKNQNNEDLENKLFARLTSYIDEKIDKSLQNIHMPFEIIIQRLENLEQNTKKLDEVIFLNFIMYIY